jgi:hypothetical protein
LSLKYLRFRLTLRYRLFLKNRLHPLYPKYPLNRSFLHFRLNLRFRLLHLSLKNLMWLKNRLSLM